MVAEVEKQWTADRWLMLEKDSRKVAGELIMMTEDRLIEHVDELMASIIEN